jgi:ferrous iron transport protein A
MSAPAARSSGSTITLSQLQQGQAGIITSLDVPLEVAWRLMELGFVPGATVTAAAAAPGGDPVVYRVDGGEIALRRETARRLGIQAPA